MFGGKILLAGYTTLLVVLALFSVNCYAKKGHHPCNPSYHSSCGNIHNITYPFTLKGDTNPENCRDQNHELGCENNRTVLSLFSGKYYVEEINYDKQTIRVVDVGIHKDDCYSLPLHSLTYDYLTTSFPYYLPYLDALVVFMNCENPVKSPLYIDNNRRGSCTKGGGNSSGSVKGQYLYVVVGDLTVSDVADLCTVEMVIVIAKPPASLMSGENGGNMSFLDVHNAMAYGFELSFDSYSGRFYHGSYFFGYVTVNFETCRPHWSFFHCA